MRVTTVHVFEVICDKTARARAFLARALRGDRLHRNIPFGLSRWLLPLPYRAVWVSLRILTVLYIEGSRRFGSGRCYRCCGYVFMFGVSSARGAACVRALLLDVACHRGLLVRCVGFCICSCSCHKCAGAVPDSGLRWRRRCRTFHSGCDTQLVGFVGSLRGGCCSLLQQCIHCPVL